jgi:hypothetical protein
MRNPFEDEKDLTDYRVSRRSAIVLSALFLLAITLPPLGDFLYKAATGQLATSPVVRLLSYNPKTGPTLHEHLLSVERSLTDLPYAKTIRRQTQYALTAWAGEGNMKVHPGNNGWLFYRPELAALNGWGPIKKQPFSVMKDPALGKLKPARELILQFAADLKARGIPLLLVPLPVKPMLYHEHLLNKTPDEPLRHPDQLAFYDQLRAAGIDVLDLTQPLYDLKKRYPLFLKQDTHWTPEAMKKSAELVAAHIKKTHPTLLQTETTPRIDARIHDRTALGDLVNLLDLPHPETLYQKEPAQLVSIAGLDPTPTAPISLLGDSFVNIYTDPTLGFEDPATPGADPAPPMNAGFASQLALLLGQPLDVIAKNGAGTTATRREFASRPDDIVRAKKLVIWVLASRDLLYSPTAAREANIEWDTVTFNPNTSKPAPDPTSEPATPTTEGKVIVEAELLIKSTNQSPDATPYPDALHTALYRVKKIIAGTFDPEANWQAIQWTFKKKEMQPTATFTPGQTYRLTLVPWDTQTALQSLNRSADKTDEDDFLAERWFIESAEPLP